MMSVYKDKRIRGFQILAYPFKALAYVLNHWLFFLIIAIVVSPITPHMLIEYSYINRGTQRYMVDCNYLGARGTLRYVESGGKCPLVTIIDRRNYS